MRHPVILAFASLVAGAALPLHAAGLPGGGIQADNVAAHLRTLASDEFEGRAPATAGEDRTIAYLIEQFRKAGLQPGGDDGGWTQAVDMDRTTIDGEVALAIDSGGTTRLMRPIALSTNTPVGSPLAARSMRPPAGSFVAAVTPAARMAAAVASTA